MQGIEGLWRCLWRLRAIFSTGGNWFGMRTDTIWSRAASGTRHEAAGERAVTAESYAAELAKMKAARPGVRVAVYDHIFWENRAWFRFTFRWRDPETSNPLTQAGMQSYRIEDGKLAETWIVLQPVGSSWPDAVAQEHWTSPPPYSN